MPDSIKCLAERLRFPNGAILAAGLLVCLLTPVSAQAGNIDQQQTSVGFLYPINSTTSTAQTFTAGQSGQLDQVDLYLDKVSASLQLNIELRNAVGGSPGTQVLANAILPPSAVPASPAFVPVNFPASVPVTAGTQYAIVAYTGSASPNGYEWGDQNGNPYASGNELLSFSSPPASWTAQTVFDTAFKTYVIPPSSSTGQRAAALSKCKKKHTRQKRRKCRQRANKLPV